MQILKPTRPTVKLYLDKRSSIKEGEDKGKFPVKIRVTFKEKGKYIQPCYPSNIDDNSYFYLSEFDFIKIKAEKAKGGLGVIDTSIANAKKKVNDILDDMPFLSHQGFDEIYYGKTTRQTQINLLFDEVINSYKAQGLISSYRSYQSAKNSLNDYSAGITFTAIDKDFLIGYQRDMTKNGKSITTVAIYLRNLRHIFLLAIERDLVAHKYYPFGRKGYVIPETENIKKAVAKPEYQKLLDYHFKTSAAKEFHLSLHKLSYYLIGMNMADIAFLKEENITNDSISYFRRKTRNTLRIKKPVTIPYHPEARKIIEKYGIHRPYLFGIIEEGMTEANIKNKIAKWLKKVASAVEEACNDLKMPVIDFYTAKHTANTRLLQNKVDIKTLQELNGHTKITTTERYTKSLDLEEKKTLVNAAL